MSNITHNNTAVSAEELEMVAADGRTKANHQAKFRAMGAVTAQLHGWPSTTNSLTYVFAALHFPVPVIVFVRKITCHRRKKKEET